MTDCYLVKICHLSPLIGALHSKIKCFPNRNALSSKSDFLEKTLVKTVIFYQTVKVFSFLHWESKTKNRIRIHARVCFLQSFKNVLLKIFHQTKANSHYETYNLCFFFLLLVFEAVKPQQCADLQSVLSFTILVLGEHFKWIL